MEQKDTECANAIWNLALVHKQGGDFVDAHDRLLTSQKKQHSLQIGTLQKQLQELKKVRNRLHTKIWKLQKSKPKTRNSIARQDPAVQHLVAACELETVHALEQADDYQQQAAQWKKEMEKVKKMLEMSESSLEAALKECRTESPTDWVNELGKKGERYKLYIKEMGMSLMASELSASQAVYCLSIFMQKTYPTLELGIDYRIPSESSFKEWGEALYEVATTINRSRLDQALIIYYQHDDSPRNGFNYHGSTCEAIFAEGSSRERHHIPLGLEILEGGEHRHHVTKGLELLGGNLVKMPSVMSDNAAKDVGAAMFLAKADMVALIRTHEDVFSAAEIEVMETNFVDTCITHGGDLASKKHFTAMEHVVKDVFVLYNAATLLQRFVAVRIIRRHMANGTLLNENFMNLFAGLGSGETFYES